MADALQDTLRDNFPRLSSSQLTIFYSGSVKVYENVPADKAHAVMLLLASCNEHKNRTPSMTEPRMPNTKNAMAGDASAVPSHLNAPITGFQSINRISPSSSQRASPPSEKKPPVVVCRRSQAELPYARKASLARFLEKRKDRVQVSQATESEEEEALSEEPSKRTKL